MKQIIRAIGYTGSLQTLTMPVGYKGNVTAYLWGGGGGGGGNDSRAGGTGGGGGFSRITFNAQSGQVITVAVGGGGGGGLSGRSAGGGGAGGGSYTGVIFNTRYPPAGPAAVEAVTYRSWSSFMNSNAVWNSGGAFSGRNFNRSYSVNFPITGLYSFYCAADNIATVSLDGVPVVVTADSFRDDPPPTLSNVAVTAGIHTISWESVNTGGPGGFALRITQNNIDGYGGGRGGNAGANGTSGGGGGGGGATVLFVGSDLQAIAGGGAAGGGGGNNNVFAQNAPGTAGQAIQYTTNGQNGEDKSGDGGGGGGGGGGDRGGNGGATVGGDSGALAGAFGLSTGNVIATPVGRTPGNNSSVYYSGFAGLGGDRTQAGNGGYAVLEIEPDTVQVYQFGQWNPSTPYVNDQGVWKEVQGVFIYQSGEWKPVAGTNSNYAPAFVVSPNNENFGTNSRTTAGGNGGGGGGKIICNKLAQLGYFDPAMNAADQQFGRELKVKDPAAYHGYLRWAQTVVDLMDGQGSERLRRWVLFWQKDAEKRVDIQKRIVIYYMNLLARPWAEEMAYRMQAPGYTQSNPAGKLIMNIGMPLNRVVSRLNGKQLPLPVKILTIWSVVSVLLAAVTVITIGNKLKSWLFK
jgi:hypothetical protein